MSPPDDAPECMSCQRVLPEGDGRDEMRLRLDPMNTWDPTFVWLCGRCAVERGGKQTVKLYIAGPMTRYPDLNREVFAGAEKCLSVAGFVVCNPAPFEEDGWTQADYIRWALRQMLTCDGVATLPNWAESWGADIEVRTAHAVLLPVLPVGAWVARGIEAAP